MEYFRKLLADLPAAETVLADAYAAYPGRPELANISARVVLEGLYLAARYALEGLVERVEREDAQRTDPDDDEADDDAPDMGDPVALLALEVLPLSVVDDVEACDVGRLPRIGSDPTRRDLRGTV